MASEGPYWSDSKVTETRLALRVRVAVGPFQEGPSEVTFESLRLFLGTVIFEIITCLIQKTLQDGNGNFEELNSNDFQDGEWESMDMKG